MGGNYWAEMKTRAIVNAAPNDANAYCRNRVSDKVVQYYKI